MKNLRPSWIAAALATATLCCLVPALKRAGGSPAASEVEEEAGAKSERAGLGVEDEAQIRTEQSSLKTQTAVREGSDSAAQIAALLTKRWGVSDPEARRALQDELKRLERVGAEETAQKAAELGLPLVSEAGASLVGFEGELPLYDISHNANAAISTATDVVRQTAPLELDGKDIKIGLWDVYYAPNKDHDEISGRVDIKDNAVEGGLHPTHVAATMIGEGKDPRAKGMAPEAKVWSYSSTDMLNELAAVAALGPDDFGNLYLSVHPYGAASGWENWGEDWYGVFSDDGNPRNDYAPLFGQYTSTTAAWDGLADNFPYHLMIKSSGNHADDEPPVGVAPEGAEAGLLEPSALLNGIPVLGTLVDNGGEAWWALNGSSLWYEYDALTHPDADGNQYNAARRGFGTVDARASAKNVLTVGSVSDAVSGGVRDLSAATLSDFSSAGPTDDGRIKPDLVANGETVYSADGNSTDAYFEWSGTSMAAASAGGSAALLVELYEQLYDYQALRSSSLKALMIHTADDLGNPGPDYRNGWGLLNTEAAANLLVDHATNSGKRFVEKSVSNSRPMDYFMVMHDGNGPLRATLCWTDVAGNWTNAHDNRSRRLVHDLNLTVTGPDGTVHYPYVMPYSSSFSPADLDAPATTGVNIVDNVEQVYLPVSEPGLYRFEVSCGGNLAENNQQYALFVSGTKLGGAGVIVANAASDQSYPALSLDPINGVANVNDVFSGTGHTYSVALSPEGIATAEIDALGNVNVTPTGDSFGPVTITLTALDSNYGSAEQTFTVNIISPIIRVDANTLAAPNEQHGGTWANAFRYLADALNVAIPGNEIWIAEGVYYPDERIGSNTNNSSDSFVIGEGVRVYGGFAGTEVLRAERDPATHQTILSGDIHQDDLQQPIASYLENQTGESNNSYHVVMVLWTKVETILDGVVVTAGRADGNGFVGKAGAAIYIEDSELRIENCLFTGNNANSYGGAIYSYQAEVDVVHCRFLGNRCSSDGGAAYLDKSTVNFSHCEFRGNYATDGGAIWIWKDALTVSHCLFSGNIGFLGGGAMHIDQGEFLIENSTFSANHTLGQGGALYIWRGGGLVPTAIRNSVFWNNHGGGSPLVPAASIYVDTFTERPTISNSLVANSGASTIWNAAMGIDGGGNLDADPLFAGGIDPGSLASGGGNFALATGSPAIDQGDAGALPSDLFDLDGDGDTSEAVPVDLAGNTRIWGPAPDLGAYELVDPTLVDSDGDGLSDEFEMQYGGASGNIEADSDDDGDGLSAMAEFLHGQDPTAPLRKPIAAMQTTEYAGSTYLTMTFEINPVALNFATYTVERRANLASPLGWRENQAILVSSGPSPNNPALLEVTFRSLVPFGQDRMEFLRLRHNSLGN